MVQLPKVKSSEDIFIRFDKIHERDRHPDGRTDGRTDTARRHRPRLCMASLGKHLKQEAQVSQRGREMFRVIECFAKSLEVIQGHTK